MRFLSPLVQGKGKGREKIRETKRQREDQGKEGAESGDIGIGGNDMSKTV
jgi:hypothetical protein